MSTRDLDELARTLERQGADGLRLELVKRARNFKRTWLEMAEALVRVRNLASYREWGYEDFHAYCSIELQLKRATVDKLTMSYSALEQHAPNVLLRDGLAQPIPPVDAVDYFARALRGDEPANDSPRERPPAPAKEVIDELRHAVFDEGMPVAALRKRFDPVLRPKSEEDERSEALHRTSAALRKLVQALEGLEELDPERKDEVLRVLSDLERDLDAMAPAARKRAANG
ncbi:MAG: hypothetical protein U0230_04720 [Polyangiales bacterium]